MSLHNFLDCTRYEINSKTIIRNNIESYDNDK